MDRAGAITQVKAVGSFDVPGGDDTIGPWVDLALSRLGTESRYCKATMNLGPTVSAQTAYTLPATVYMIEQLLMAGIPWKRVGWEEGQAVKGGLRQIVNTGGIYWPTFSDAGVRQIELADAPTSTGDAITALCVVYPTSFDQVPEDFHMAVVHRAVAEGLSLVEESNSDADWHLAYYEREKEELRRLSNRQVSSENQQALIAGLHY